MPKTNAYTRNILPVGTGLDENNSVHEVSPAWVLTFVTWNVRDTLRAVGPNGLSQTLLQVREPIVVENDCEQVSVNVNKATLTDSMNAILVETDINYATAVAPGDFVFVNMLNWEEDARRVANQARAKQPINGINDGFKGFFKVQGVRKVNHTDPITGIRRVLIKINGFCFTEFNNSIYFNPYILTGNSGSDKEKIVFATNLLDKYSQLVSSFSNPTCQDIIQGLIQLFIGRGVDDRGSREVDGVLITPNVQFYIPALVGQLLGVPNAIAAKDIYNYMMGIQVYSSSPHQTLQSGMNSAFNQSPVDRVYKTGSSCRGQTLFNADYWNNVQAWSIISQYINAPLNELYTCFRVSPEGTIMPTVVYRQTPFTSDLFGQTPFKSNSLVTLFLSLPRWKIDSALILSYDLGRDESARINFFQMYTKPPEMTKAGGSLSSQTADINYVQDVNDVARSGLRPSIITTAFQDLTVITEQANKDISRDWAIIVGDALMGGHLKLNGTLESAGIVDPIAVGDNLEHDGTVYHIEEVVHLAAQSPETGIKSFRTTLKLSAGVSVSDNRSGLAYPEMINTNAYRDRASNFNNGDKSLPGISEEQSVVDRSGTVPTQQNIDRANAPFAQPGQTLTPIKNNNRNNNG